MEFYIYLHYLTIKYQAEQGYRQGAVQENQNPLFKQPSWIRYLGDLLGEIRIPLLPQRYSPSLKETGFYPFRFRGSSLIIDPPKYNPSKRI